MVVATATRAQLAAKTAMLTVDEGRDIGRAHHSGSPDRIGQTRLPLSFPLANTTSHTRTHVPSTVPDPRAILRDSEYVIAFASRSNNNGQSNYSFYEGEALAAV